MTSSSATVHPSHVALTVDTSNDDRSAISPYSSAAVNEIPDVYDGPSFELMTMSANSLAAAGKGWLGSSLAGFRGRLYEMNARFGSVRWVPHVHRYATGSYRNDRTVFISTDLKGEATDAAMDSMGWPMESSYGKPQLHTGMVFGNFPAESLPPCRSLTEGLRVQSDNGSILSYNEGFLRISGEVPVTRGVSWSGDGVASISCTIECNPSMTSVSSVSWNVERPEHGFKRFLKQCLGRKLSSTVIDASTTEIDVKRK